MHHFIQGVPPYVNDESFDTLKLGYPFWIPWFFKYKSYELIDLEIEMQQFFLSLI